MPVDGDRACLPGRDERVIAVRIPPEPGRQASIALNGLTLTAVLTMSLVGCGSHESSAAITSATPTSATQTSLVPTTPTTPATTQAPPSASPATLTTYTESDAGSTVHVKRGDQFIIALGSNSKIVDNWNMQTSRGLTVVGTGWDPTKIPSKPTMRGADGTESWTLLASSAGKKRLEAMAFGKGQYGGVLTDFKMTIIVS